MTGRPIVAAGLARDPRAHLTSVFLVFTAGVMWSLGGLFFRLVRDADAVQVMFYRSGFVIIAISIAIALFNRGALFSVIRRAGSAAAIGGFCISIASISFLLSIEYTSVANAVFMLAAVPFFAALLGWWILNERVSRVTWIAMLIGTLGLVLMVANGIGAGHAVGNGLALYAAFAAASFTVILRWGHDTDMMPAVFYTGVIGMIMALIMLLLPLPWRDGSGFGELAISAYDVGICALMGFVQLALGLGLYTIGSRTLSAAELTLLSLSEPLLAPFWVWLVVAEVPETLTLVGGAILMAAIVFQALAGARRKRVGFVQR
jgi:DME family drug/metabolite transporter